MFLKIGHRGAMGHAPENTLKSFQKALELNVCAVELDVHVCKSGELVVIHFALRHQYFSAAFGCWWLTTALLSVSIYAADAEEMALPFLGGDAVLHDWFHILLQLNLLQYDDLIGYLFWCGGVLAVGLLLFFLYKDKDIKVLLHRHTLR